ncbi:MAG: TAT-variant-translocated molybdopterin oxidoreductase [Verrucomicrobiales bacterium]|nr:TAT-variant-translocated molybdopterin oxidoreductase [Verrucomicrobiales bacterium]
MSLNPSLADSAATGRVYWRGLDELARTPEFQQWLEREFPEGATEFTDEVSRRQFLKLMSASFLLAGVGLGATGCRRPVEHLMPFGQAPENYIHGTAQYFATAMPGRLGAIPLIAKSYEGRPVKLEGNPLFPEGNGGTDRYAQAAILNLYDPDRATRCARKGNSGRLETVPREAALDALAALGRELAARQGEGFCLLAERTHSPSRRRLHQELAARWPRARWFLYDAIDSDVHRRAATRAFGRSLRPVFRFDRARVILSLDCDFIGGEDDAHNHIRRFTARRKIEKPGDSMSRLYAVESLFTLTGANADHRLRLPAGAVGQLAAAIAAEVGVPGAAAVPRPEGVDARWIVECARDLKAAGAEALVVAGVRQPLAVHLLAHAINAALGSVGQTVELLETPPPIAEDLPALVEALNAGRVQTLVILGANPAYNAPADLNWPEAQAKARTVVRLGYYEDETGVTCDWHFPLAHFLESWGDARTSNGTLVPIQPLIQPLFGGITELEFLARLGGLPATNPHDIVRETFRRLTGGDEEAWKQFLHDGFWPGTADRAVKADLQPGIAAEALAAIPQQWSVSKDSLEIVLHRDYRLDDGRYANNGWLQEFPDPITKITWDNAALMSRRTARALGLKNEDVIEITCHGRTIKAPVWIQPGMADFSIGLALGYGRTKVGRVGQDTGFDAYPLWSSRSGYVAAGATVRTTGQRYPIACTQTHWSMEGRAIVREANLQQFEKHPDFVRAMDAHKPPVEAPLYPNPLDAVKPRALHQWGMSIDLNACVGCGTCVLACQSENNIPIVGKDQVQRGREMHWMRIDRYYASDPARRRPLDVFRKDEEQQFEEWIDEVQAVNQPMLCQHCEAAPCENVCPVNATVHDHEGLNVMVYNRCVGTRYCSNNCPYKVRRFNYLDYNKRPLSELKGPFYSSPLTHRTGGQWDLLRWWRDPQSGMRPEDEWDLIRMVKNPDVTVRMRGVMEKCTFCIQRIEQAKIAQKVKAGASGDVVVPDGVIQTACQQACPADAIVFGNVADPNSRVSRLKRQSRDYAVLEFLLTKPRTTYLARVRNPNPAMPDYTEWPLSFAEFEKKAGGVHLDAPHGSHGGAPAPAHGGKGGH